MSGRGSWRIYPVREGADDRPEAPDMDAQNYTPAEALAILEDAFAYYTPEAPAVTAQDDAPAEDAYVDYANAA